jgi:hypothetical protein
MNDGLLNENECYRLVLYAMKINQLRSTRFYEYYLKNRVQLKMEFNSNSNKTSVEENLIEDKNDEFLRSFLAILRLFFLKRDKIKLDDLSSDLFSEDGSLVGNFPDISQLYNKIKEKLENYLKSRPQYMIKVNQYHFESNQEMIDNFIYGGLIHTNKDKFESYCAFNLRKNIGTRYFTYRSYRTYIIIIVLNIISFLEQIYELIVSPIIQNNTDLHWNLIQKYESQGEYDKALKYLTNLSWLYSKLENYTEQLKIYQKRHDLQINKGDPEGAKNSLNICKDIQDFLNGKIPDLSDYKTTADIKIR